MTGILLIDKPSGWTSSDVVAKLRGVLRERRIGHSGTLDPMATGLLVVFVGRATRAVEFAESQEKRYRAGLRLGLETDTQDITGHPIGGEKRDVSVEELEKALASFHGEIEQIPPMYSAIKGTYVRTLCHDIGRAMGCGGCMSSLRRTRAGAFRLEDAHTLDDVQKAADAGQVESLLLPVDTLFDEEKATISGKAEAILRVGGQPGIKLPEGRYRIYSDKGEFLALCKAEQGKLLTIKSFFEV